MGHMRGRRWSGYSALALAAAALIVGERRASTGVIVTTAEASAGTIQRRIVRTGTLEPVASVDVSANVSGTVESINADISSLVRAGQVLARLDSASVEAHVREAEASELRPKSICAASKRRLTPRGRFCCAPNVSLRSK